MEQWNALAEQLKNFIKPELLILIPVLYWIGYAVKRSTVDHRGNRDRAVRLVCMRNRIADIVKRIYVCNAGDSLCRGKRICKSADKAKHEKGEAVINDRRRIFGDAGHCLVRVTWSDRGGRNAAAEAERDN